MRKRSKPATGVMIHHAAARAEKFQNADDARQKIYEWHKNRGFQSIGYHHIWHVNKKGMVSNAQGRDTKYHGAHCKGMNIKTLGICIAADLTIKEDKSLIYNAEAKLIRSICMWIEIQERKDKLIAAPAIINHNLVANTECPGINIAGWVCGMYYM